MCLKGWTMRLCYGELSTIFGFLFFCTVFCAITRVAVGPYGVEGHIG